jgi:hypothetical protein
MLRGLKYFSFQIIALCFYIGTGIARAQDTQRSVLVEHYLGSDSPSRIVVMLMLGTTAADAHDDEGGGDVLRRGLFQGLCNV